MFHAVVLNAPLPQTITMSFNDKSLRTVQHLKGNRHEQFILKRILGGLAQTRSPHNLQWGVLTAGQGLQRIETFTARHSSNSWNFSRLLLI